MRILVTTTAAALLAGGLLCAQTKDKPRVFVAESKSWEVKGGGGAVDGSGGGGVRGGARPQTAEIIKTVNQRCPEVIVTMNKDNADYTLLLDHEGGKEVIRRDNKFVLFNREGDAIRSGSTRSLGNAVKEACGVIVQNWTPRPTDRSQ